MDFNSDDEYKNLITGDLEGLFKRAERFITECISKSLVNRLDSSLPQRPWMLEFEENFNNIDKINIILISNGKFSGRRKEFPAKEILEKGLVPAFRPHCYTEIANSRTGSEPITIDMDDYEDFELRV